MGFVPKPMPSYMHRPPVPPKPPSSRLEYGRKPEEIANEFERYIPCLLITKSPLLILHAKKNCTPRFIRNLKHMYAGCDPVVRSFVHRGAHDQGVDFVISHDYEAHVNNGGFRKLDIVTDSSTGVSFAFAAIGRDLQPFVYLRATPESDWYEISRSKNDYLYVVSLFFTISAIHQKDSELSYLREVEKARTTVLAKYGNR